MTAYLEAIGIVLAILVLLGLGGLVLATVALILGEPRRPGRGLDTVVDTPPIPMEQSGPPADYAD